MPRDEFKETIKLIFEADKESMTKVEQEVENLSKLNISGINSRKFEEFKLLSQEYNKKLSDLRELENIPGEWAEEIRKTTKEWISDWEDAMGITAQKEEEKKTEKQKQLAEDAASLMKYAFESSIDKLKDVLKDSWKELENMLNYSLLSNKETRQLALGYGFSASQAYGYQKAMGALGFQSEEDLMYANQQQIQLFREAFDNYSQKYQKLYDSGMFSKLLEYQVEMNEFKEDLKLEFVTWFVDNKDVIKTGMTALMEIAKTAMSILSWLTHSSVTSQSGTVSDLISSYSNNKSVNVSMSNTFNGVDGSQNASLVQFGTNVVEQLITAFEQA